MSPSDVQDRVSSTVLNFGAFRGEFKLTDVYAKLGDLKQNSVGAAISNLHLAGLIHVVRRDPHPVGPEQIAQDRTINVYRADDDWVTGRLGGDKREVARQRVRDLLRTARADRAVRRGTGKRRRPAANLDRRLAELEREGAALREREKLGRITRLEAENARLRKTLGL